MESKNITPEKKNYNVTEHVPKIVESLHLANTYFLFRADGTQIRFTTINGELRSKQHILNSNEISYIRKNIINKEP